MQTPEALVGPKDWPMDECEIDFREGGSWLYCLPGPNDGDEAWGKAHYNEIQKPRKIVYSDYFTDSNGTIDRNIQY